MSTQEPNSLREAIIEAVRGDQVIHNNTGYSDNQMKEVLYGTKADAILTAVIGHLPEEDTSQAGWSWNACLNRIKSDLEACLTPKREES